MAALNRLAARVVTSKMAKGMYADGGGLYLKVTDTGTKSFVFRFRHEGKERYLGLGSTNEVTLASARIRALEIRTKLAAGVDPFTAREQEAETERRKELALDGVPTFREAAEAFIADNKSTWSSPVHTKQWSSTMRDYVYPTIGSKRVNEITTADIAAILQPIWLKKIETAQRVRRRIERVLSRCKALGQRSGENPASLLDNLEHVLASQSRVRKVKHHTAMPWADMPAFMLNLATRPAMAALCLRFAILTACRTSEALLARWEEIDEQTAVWTIPAERMKTRREHAVPLSTAALAVLKAARDVRKKSPWVFANPRTRKPFSNMAMLTVLRRMKIDVTVHGFRSSFRDWAAEAGYPREIAEAALAHAVEDAVERAYRRTTFIEKRRDMMEAWGTYCTTKKPV